jgi:hypothetical protein
LDINLFSKIVKKLGETDIEDFEYTIDGKIYGFKDVGDDVWDDQGKYQYKYEQGQLIEMNKKYKEIQSFNFGVSRTIQRSGSYFSDYYYEKEPYEYFKIKEVLIPEKIIPAHIENKWNKIKIDLNKVIDEEEEERKRLEAEKIRLEEEVKAEKERLTKLYPMNKPEIIKMVNKNLKKKEIKITIQNMRKEYFDIVVKKKLESQEWIDYHKSIFENIE